MKIKVNQLKAIFQKYQEHLQIKYLSDLIIRGNAFLSNDIVMPDHIPQLEENNIEEVKIYYEHTVYKYLCGEFPNSFRKPTQKMNFLQFDRYLEMLNSINNQSKRKRYVKMVGDIYGIDSKEGTRTSIIAHDESVDYKKWNSLKRNMDKDHIFYFRSSEVPIVIFVDLSNRADSKYVERFTKNTDLISIMVSKVGDRKEIIAPDFIPTEDVISVTDPNLLLEEYIKSNARLIIIGEQLNDSYKKALISIRKYDRFVRMLVVPTLDRSNLDHFFKQVHLVYNTDRWEE